MNEMTVWEAIQGKRAIRDFKDVPLPEDVAARILDAGRRAQSAKNTQPWDFIVVQERERLQALAACGDFLGHVAGAAMAVCMVTPAPDDPRYIWHMFDIGQAASYMQLAAFEIGVASCPGTVYDEDKARALLGFPAEKSLRLLLSFGYPAESAASRGLGKQGRRPLGEVVHWERW